MLSDWRLDERGQIKDDFADPRSRAARPQGSLVFANGAPAPLQLRRPAGRARPASARQRRHRAADQFGIDGAKTLIVAVDGQPSEPFEPLRNQFPMGPGARFELMFDMPRERGARVRFVAARRRGRRRISPSSIIAGAGEPVAGAPPRPRLPANPLLPAEIALELARAPISR